MSELINKNEIEGGGSSVVVVDLRSNGFLFETHRWHCVITLSKTTYPLLGTGSAQEDRKPPNMFFPAQGTSS